jgi:hypothetical protein
VPIVPPEVKVDEAPKKQAREKVEKVPKLLSMANRLSTSDQNDIVMSSNIDNESDV